MPYAGAAVNVNIYEEAGFVVLRFSPAGADACECGCYSVWFIFPPTVRVIDTHASCTVSTVVCDRHGGHGNESEDVWYWIFT